jgi:UDP-N-acetylglucosamine 2-epimerase (non-hydrolysing)
MKKVLLIFGTRPEAIKMAPVYHALKRSPYLEPVVCVSAQHRQMLDQVLMRFKIEVDFDLNVMRPGQDLSSITSSVLLGLKDIFNVVKPDVALVHGDTSTTFAAALAAYYARVPIGHVEAGLRTFDKYSPFPEEMNRSMIAPVVDFHFAPTMTAQVHLDREGVSRHKTFVTGNTAIDALLATKAVAEAIPGVASLPESVPVILMTAHRRENFGKPIESIFRAIYRFALTHPEVMIVYPVHPNPNVKPLAEAVFADVPNVMLLPPVDYFEMVYLIDRCQFIVTDSGGLQEEGPTFGKPVLVLRDTTERPEAIEARCAKLVGCDEGLIYSEMSTLLDKTSFSYLSMSQARNPFGDGRASERIVDILERHLVEDYRGAQAAGSVQ